MTEEQKITEITNQVKDFLWKDKRKHHKLSKVHKKFNKYSSAKVNAALWRLIDAGLADWSILTNKVWGMSAKQAKKRVGYG